MNRKGILTVCIGLLFLTHQAWAAQATASVLEPSLHSSQRLISVNFEHEPLADALHKLARKAKVGISYKTEVIPDKRVTYKAKNTSVYTVLDSILKGTGLYAALSENRKVILIKNRLELQKTIQQSTITGTVTDVSSGETLPGVNILVIGTNRGTSTNGNGKYELNVESLQDTLRFSYIGYKPRKIPIKGRTKINVALKTATTGLGEMIVTGYSQESKAGLAGSVSTVDSVAIADVPAQNAESVLQGRAAGVQVTSSSGNPGAGLNIQIRGNGSINAGTEPLYIVDGVEVNTANQSGLTEQSPLNKIDPNDIASIQILKDAASAAIYGAQAANGVVVITTKRGTQGATKISAKVERGIRKNINTYNLVNSQEYLTYYQDALDLSDQGILDFGNSFGYAYAGTPYSSIEAFPTYDWQDNIYTTGYHQGYSITASGGDAKTRFYISGSYDKTQGTIRGSNFDRFAFRTNFDHQVNDKLSTKVNINLANNNQFGLCQQGNSIACPVSNSAFQPPVAPAYLPNGNYNPKTLFGATSNEALLLNEETRNVSDVSIFGNVSATYDFTDWLSLRGLFGLDWKTNSDERFRPPVLAPADNGSIYKYIRGTYNFTTNAVLNFNHSFNEVHNLSGFVATEYRRDYNDGSGATGIGLSNDLLNVLNAAATASAVYGSNTEYRVASYFSNVKYNYDQRYYLSLTGRYDGSSRFGKNNRWGFFPSVAVAWRIADEDFFNANFVNTLKLKASYGVTGNAAINNFQSRGTYGVSGTYLGQNGLSPTRLANPDLTWEESREFNIGVDYGFFNNRINGSIETYRRNSENLLLNRPLPLDSGFGSVTQNVGTVQNQGIEFNIETVNIQQGDLRWSTSLNLTVQKNTVTKLNAGQDQLNSGSTPIAVGHSIRAWWVPQWAGVNPADGRPMWYDKNGNITYTPTLEDRKFFDGGDQDVYGGFGTTLSYKGVSLNALFQGSYGKTGEPGSLVIFLRTPTFRGVVDKSVLRSWNHPGQITDLPRPVSGDAPDGSANWRGLGAGTGALYNASYIRLKSITLSYDFPVSLTNKFNVRGLRLYFSAYNLYTWANWPSINAEMSGNSNYANYPPALQVNGGIKIDF